MARQKLHQLRRLPQRLLQPRGHFVSDLRGCLRERRHAAGLMRINHTGEVCAQALYVGQAAVARDEATREQLLHAAQEETDHLAWCADRLRELDSRPSVFNPLWYAGSYALGALAGLRGDGWSLGFVVETERQVEAHLASHMDRLPAHDHASRAIVAQMKQDEARHAREAQGAGAVELPAGTEGRLFFEDSTGRGVVYPNDPEKSAKAHLRPGVFTLGEIGYVTTDGFVYITDRFSDMIVSGGVNIYPAVAEKVLIEHPKVAY